MITTEQIKKLRDGTGVSVMQCKRALEEAEGDFDKALLILKKRSTDIALKKSDRTLGAGIVVIRRDADLRGSKRRSTQIGRDADLRGSKRRSTQIGRDTDKAVMVVLYCETDFVAKNDEFIKLANQIADIVNEKGEEIAKNESVEPINLLIQKIGENIKLGEINIFEGNTLGSYVHNGKIGVLVSLEGGTQAIARDIAMHIAAMKPEFTSRENIPIETKESIASLFAEEIKILDKPEEIKKKIMDGKIDTYFKERTLLDQTFIKNPDITIAELLKQAGGAKIKEFVRFSF